MCQWDAIALKTETGNTRDAVAPVSVMALSMPSAALACAAQQLVVIAGDATTLIGEQGEPARAGELDAHMAYWSALEAEVRIAQPRGDDATTVPTTLPGVDASRTRGTAHALNWQRAWRHAEDEAMKP